MYFRISKKQCKIKPIFSVTLLCKKAASRRGSLDRLNLVNGSTQTVNLSSCLGVHVSGTIAIITEEAPAFVTATA